MTQLDKAYLINGFCKMIVTLCLFKSIKCILEVEPPFISKAILVSMEGKWKSTLEY